MHKQILSNQAKNEVSYNAGTEFSLMTNDNYRITKRILSLLLKRFTLLIELNDKKIIMATYKDLKLIGRTDTNILLVYDELKDEEAEINIDDIRIIRVCK